MTTAVRLWTGCPGNWLVYHPQRYLCRCGTPFRGGLGNASFVVELDAVFSNLNDSMIPTECHWSRKPSRRQKISSLYQWNCTLTASLSNPFQHLHSSPARGTRFQIYFSLENIRFGCSLSYRVRVSLCYPQLHITGVSCSFLLFHSSIFWYTIFNMLYTNFQKNLRKWV